MMDRVHGRRMKCILVEDDPFWVAEISAILADDDVELLVARDGRAALKLVKAHPDAAMVLDMILPEVDGVQVLQGIRRIAPEMRVLAITGGGRIGADFYLRLARQFGANSLLAKPFTDTQLKDGWRSITTP